jgi:hypothetical protein
MKKLIVLFLISFIISGLSSAQNLNLKSINSGYNKIDFKPSLSGLNKHESKNSKEDIFDYQLKKRSTSTMYFGAGYSFIIFTEKNMSSAYPVLNVSKGEFLSEINVFFGYSIAKALTMEIEPSILFSSSERYLIFNMIPPVTLNGTNFSYVFPQRLNLMAFPIIANIRFFPMFKQKSFARLFFIGGGIGYSYIWEEYDNIYSNDALLNYNTYYFRLTESTSQWQPVFRGMLGFTGAGGQFGFGGEVRFNYVPLETSNQPFTTRISKNFTSVDLSLRFYFSL